MCPLPHVNHRHTHIQLPYTTPDCRTHPLHVVLLAAMRAWTEPLKGWSLLERVLGCGLDGPEAHLRG